jgi:CHRD domain/Secretion system C-terminal sorting domain
MTTHSQNHADSIIVIPWCTTKALFDNFPFSIFKTCFDMKKQYTILVALIVLSAQLLMAQRSGRMLVTARLNGANEVPAVATKAKGLVTAVIEGNNVTINAVFDSLSGPVTGCHFHKGVEGTNGGVFGNYTTSVRGNRLYLKTTLTNAQIGDMMEDSVYFNVHTAANTNGEIRGQMIFETDYMFTAFARGANEVPAVTTSATAVGGFVLSRTGSKIDYKIVANGLSGAIASAHLHYGAVGKNGAVALTLTATDNVLTGSSTMPTGFLDSLFSGNVYLNIHTATNANGEIRGQVLYQSDGIAFDAFADGAQEVPPVNSVGKSIFVANIRPNLDTLEYIAQVSGVNAFIAHLHYGAVGVTGGVAGEMFLADASLPNVYRGSIAMTPSLLSGFLQDLVYTNFHTTRVQTGEIRGQVQSLLRTGLVSNLCGGQEVPAVSTNATGAAFVSLARDKSNLFLDVVTNGLSSNASGAHIHLGTKGASGAVAVDLTTALNGNAVRGSLNITNPVLGDSIAKGSTYFNFHNTANPNGEIRGQIAPNLVQECLANATLELNGAQFSVKIAPNPAFDNAQIIFDSNEQFAARMVITDISGRQISSKNVVILRGPNSIDVSVAQLTNGIYFIQMQQDNRRLFTEKLVKN